MINLDSITNESNKEHNEKQPYIPDHLYRIIIIGGSGSGKINPLLYLINNQNDTDKIFLYAKDLSEPKYEFLIEPKYEFLIKKSENAGIKHLNAHAPNALIECSNTMDDVYENVNDYNPSRKRKILVVFYDKIADIMTNEEFKAIIKELFIRCRKLNISLIFITQSYFSVPKVSYVRLNSTHYLIMKINSRRELQNIAINHSADTDYNDFMKIYREHTKEPFFAKRYFAKISALSSNNLDKYEYLTGQHLCLKPSIVEQAKFEYSPLGKVFTKGLDKDDQKEGLFKRLKILKARLKAKIKKNQLKMKNSQKYLKTN